jgi:hypothetical protein
VDDLATAGTSCRTRHPAGSPCCSAARVVDRGHGGRPGARRAAPHRDSPPPASRRTRWPRSGWTRMAVTVTAAGGDIEAARALMNALPGCADPARAAARRLARPAHGSPRRGPGGAHRHGRHSGAAPGRPCSRRP